MSPNTRVHRILLTLAVAAAFIVLLVGSSSQPVKVNQYRVRDAILWKDLEVTVLGMKRANEYSDLELKQDYEFIVVNVQFKGRFACSYPDDPDQLFLMQGSESYSPVVMYIDKENPYVYRFAADEVAKGTYVYMVPKGKTGLTLRFEHYEQDGMVQSHVLLEE